LKKRWAARWNDSPHHACVKVYEPAFPFTKFITVSKGLRRNQHNAVVQLRIGYIPLQAYLHKIKKADSDDCPACLSHGRHTAETVHHYLFDCPAYRAQWEQVSRALGHDTRNKHILLGTKKGFVAILRYMVDTKRFTNIFGDV
ncbi:hypothetical protein GGF50DRAFT_27269, partial [Schizophyllum commune]